MRSSNPPRLQHTFSADPACEAHVAQDLARLSTGIESELGDALHALLLVGPFARAEGRVARRGEQLLSQLPGYELLVVMRKRPARFTRVLGAMCATWSRLLGTRVALRALPPTLLEAPPRTRTYFHAGAGQSFELLADRSHALVVAGFDATRIESGEVEQTLLEALCAFALAELEAQDDLERLLDRADRALLAVGDATLLRRGLYAATLRERARALAHASADAALSAAYAVVVDDEPAMRGRVTRSRDELEDRRHVLTRALLDLEAERCGTPRELQAYVLGDDAAASEGSRSWRAPRASAHPGSALGTPDASGPRPSLLRACVSVACGRSVPHAHVHAARRFGQALGLPVSPEHAALAAALRAAAQRHLAIGLPQPFADWALAADPV